MDRIDKKLLNLLQRDASRTNASLADEVGLSASSCLRRIRRLRSGKIINKVVAILNPFKAGKSLKVIVTVELKEHGEKQMRKFLDLVSREEAVSQAYSVTGEADVVLIMWLKDMDEFDQFSDRVFRDQTNVLRFYTMVVIRSAKDETAIAL